MDLWTDTFLGFFRAVGIKFEVVDGRLKYDAPSEALSPEMMDEIRVQKEVILYYLAEEAELLRELNNLRKQWRSMVSLKDASNRSRWSPSTLHAEHEARRRLKTKAKQIKDRLRIIGCGIATI